MAGMEFMMVGYKALSPLFPSLLLLLTHSHSHTPVFILIGWKGRPREVKGWQQSHWAKI